jgi:hypothetical protein
LAKTPKESLRLDHQWVDKWLWLMSLHNPWVIGSQVFHFRGCLMWRQLDVIALAKLNGLMAVSTDRIDTAKRGAVEVLPPV